MEVNDEKNNTADNPPPYSGNSSGPPSVKMPTVVQTSPVVVAKAGVVVPIVVSTKMGTEPSPYVCGSCHAQIVTRVETKVTTKTHLFAGLLCFLGGLCCVWIPYFLDSCKNIDHYCPNCNAYIGSYER